MERLYVITRSRYDTGVQAVQCAHCVAQFMLTYPDKWKNSTLILLTINDLDLLIDKLRLLDILYVPFYEPDMDNEVTAVACGYNGLVSKLCLL